MIPSGHTALTTAIGDSEKTCFVTRSPLALSCRSVRWSFSTFEVKPRTTWGGELGTYPSSMPVRSSRLVWPLLSDSGGRLSGESVRWRNAS